MATIKNPVKRLASLIFPVAALTITNASARQHLEGKITDLAGAALKNVRVLPDEFGAARESSDEGRFRLALPPHVRQRGWVRVAFELESYQTVWREVKLPLKAPLEIRMIPLYFRLGSPPALPHDLAYVLKNYRRDEIAKVHDFLANRDRRLLLLRGPRGIGKSDLLITALNEAPDAQKLPLFWWDCDSLDGFGMMLDSWARAFRDDNLANLGRRGKALDDPAEQEAARRQSMFKILANLRKKPHIIVFNRLQNWLDPAKQNVLDPTLRRFLELLAGQTAGGKIVLLASEKPVFSQKINPAWRQTLRVRGLKTPQATAFLRDYLGLLADPRLLAEAAGHYNGHPYALRMLAAALADLDEKTRDNRLRDLLQTRAPTLDANDLAPLFDAARARLGANERAVLNLLAVFRQGLTADDLLATGYADSLRLTSDELRQTLDRLARRRHLLDRRNETFAAGELLRQYLSARLLRDKPEKLKLHRIAARWYAKRYPVDKIAVISYPKAQTVTGYDELAYHLFAITELQQGKKRRQTAEAAVDLSLNLRNWHVLHDLNRLMEKQLLLGLRLLPQPDSTRTKRLYAGCLENLGALYRRIDRLAAADSVYQLALPVYRQIESRLGEANTLQALGQWHAKKGEADQAIARYLQARTLFVAIDERIGQINCAMFLSDVFLEQNKFGESVKEAVVALKIVAETELPPDIVVRRLVSLQKKFGAAVFFEHLQAAAQTEPSLVATVAGLAAQFNSAGTLKIQADFFLRQEAFEKAKGFARAAVEADSSSAEAWFALAGAVYGGKKYAETISAYEHLNALAPNSASILGNMGWTYYLMENYAACVEKSRAALAADSTASWARCNLALALLHLGEPEPARREYKIVVSHVQTAADLQRQAINDLEQALAANPNLPQGRALLVWLKKAREKLP